MTHHSSFRTHHSEEAFESAIEHHLITAAVMGKIDVRGTRGGKV